MEIRKRMPFFLRCSNPSGADYLADNYDNPIIKLDDDAITSVYFGSRVPLERINQIKGILSLQGRLDSIKLYQCKLCESSYGLRFTEID